MSNASAMYDSTAAPGRILWFISSQFYVQNLAAKLALESLIWVADADVPNPDFRAALASWEDLEITVVFHNVGGSSMRESRMDEVPETELMNEVRRNGLFSYLLTRALLPQLRKVKGPVEVIFVGSFASDLPLPGLVSYGPPKAFTKQMSAMIGADERFRKASNVNTMYLAVGSVMTNNHKIAETLMAPSADDFAKAVVARIGCGKQVVTPYVWHAIQAFFVDLLPRSILEKLVADSMEEELKALKKH